MLRDGIGGAAREDVRSNHTTEARAPLLAQSQSTELHIKFKSGQPIVPIYEGWERVPDGSFNMVFGYLNRNHVEQISLPVGPQNNFEPGPADRGQPAAPPPRGVGIGDTESSRRIGPPGATRGCGARSPP